VTEVIGNVIFLYPEEEQQCDLCGKIAELRPYGPNGECVCFECGMKDEEAAMKQFRKRILNGDDNNSSSGNPAG
jgi:hypothetical protein